MPLRFVIAQSDPNSGRRPELFQAALALKRADVLPDADGEALEGVLPWFGQNLETPARLSLTRRPRRQPQAICWFRDGAVQHIGHMRRHGQVLADYGLLTEEIRTNRSGYVVYQDRHQVAAYPFADTPT